MTAPIIPQRRSVVKRFLHLRVKNICDEAKANLPGFTEKVLDSEPGRVYNIFTELGKAWKSKLIHLGDMK